MFQRDASIALRIPVRWYRRAELRINPERVEIPTAGKTQRSVFITLDPQRVDSEAIVTALAPCVNVLWQRKLNPNVVEVRIEIDADAAAADTRRTIPLLACRLALEDSPEHFLKGFRPRLFARER
ncbi:MAG TPA: hypothetical protein VMV10_27000 [Pirellulales bacterium]|nr:hypothetical protein [Pirellulales bacterium]